jgi:ectoine hydroxylase-related dioxygenase (phytanoyl-CoA dioxygenase family)
MTNHTDSVQASAVLERSGGLSLAEARERFEEDGFLVLPGVFSPDSLRAINAAHDEHFLPLIDEAARMAGDEAQRAARFACDVISWDPVREKHPLFTALLHDPELEAITQTLLGPGYTTPASLVMYSVGGGRGQAWHQDCPIEDGAGYNLNRLIYTRDVSMDDGAIVVVPGSHRAGRIPPGGHQDPMPGEVTLCPDAGTLVLLHGHVYHRVTPNLNRQPRVSLNFRAYPQGTDPRVNCIGVYRNGTVDFCSDQRGPNAEPADHLAIDRKL